jgi:hypothetical protein
MRRGFYIKELSYNGSTVASDVIRLSRSSMTQDLRVLLSAKSGTIMGNVGTDSGSAVGDARVLLVAWPARAVGQYPDGVRETTLDSDGRFRFEGLRPGIYRAVAVRAAARERLEEPGVLLAVLIEASNVEVGEAESKVLILSIAKL